MARPMNEMPANPTPPKETPGTFAQLYGIWKGKVDLSYEEIKDAEIRLKDDWVGEDADRERSKSEDQKRRS
jgi:hypothetical protein